MAPAVRALAARRSQVSRRCRPLIAAAAAAVAAVALTPVTGRAQAPKAATTPPPGPAAMVPPSSGVIQTFGTTMSQPVVPDPNALFLQPSLQGNPAAPPRFRRPGDVAPGDVAQDQAPAAGRFTAPSRIGATPIYGSPVAFGAAGSGFDSANLLKSQKKALAAKRPPPPRPGVSVPETTFDPLPTTQFTVPVPAKGPVLTPTPAPQVYPLKAANRPGAVLPPLPAPLPIDNVPPEVHPQAAANRPGAMLPVPPPIDAGVSASTPPPGTQPINTLPPGTPQRPLPIAESDAYAPIGIRGGSFMFFPALELSGGYSTNPQAIPGGPGSAYFVVAPQLLVQSDWSRHSLTATIAGTYTEYANSSFIPSLNRPYLNSKIEGRIDVTRDTQILLQNRFLVSTDNPGSPNLQAGLARLPIDTTLGGTLGVIQNFYPMVLTLKGTADRTQYQDSTLTNGETASNADRDYNQYAGIARFGFDLNTGVIPFVEVQGDQRVYDQLIDSGGEHRNSDGISAKAGAAVNLLNDLAGEMAVGYLERLYVDPTLPRIAGVTLDGSLIWQATALTTAKFTASSVVNESTVTGVSGSFSRDVNVQVDHAFRRWLIATAKLGYGQDDYVGEDRVDHRTFASIGATYKFSRELWLKGELRHDWMHSTAPNASYQATSILLGLRLQR
jgi:hypothetical protein